MVLFVFLPFVGFYLGMKYDQSISVKNVVEVQNESLPTSVTSTSDSTANWKTYQNTIRGITFLFKYPNDLYYTDDPNFGPTFFDIADKDKDPRTVTSKFGIIINDQGEDFDTLYGLSKNTVFSTDKPLVGMKSTKLQNTTMGGNKAVQYLQTYTNTVDTYYLLFTLTKVNNKYITLQTANGSGGVTKNEYLSFKPIYDQILSTLKFTN